ncbi:ATP/GTP-binding protein [Rathayibacter sp. VKM Ac-2928]|uniref:AAA family ATPase n=1 Tax=Rathayibacter sp. VKM Ac-2928 TaxID=2929479 RepID=UPI001FB43EC1|nr:ATP-binding protein [Rathayibacter sp. VKM Ac-2928]
MLRSKRSRPRTELEHASWKRPDISAVAAIYGSNASGKTTLLDAFAFIAYAVTESYKSWDPKGGVPRTPFALERMRTQEPTTFEIEFIASDGLEYQYGASFGDERIEREYLYSYKTHRRTVIFHRENDDQSDDEWYFGPSFRGPAAHIRATTRPNALFLSAAAAAGNEATKSAYSWLVNGFSLYDAKSYDSEHQHVIQKLSAGDMKYRDGLMRFLKHADLGIVSVDVVREEMSSDRRRELEQILRALPGDPDRIDEFLENRELELSFTHQGRDRDVPIPFAWESDGTQALISFASIAVKALEDGSACLVDEIDSSLHPLLVAELVSVFSDPRANPRQAQLIFTTHDVSLIGRAGGSEKLLDRDQLWVVEKNEEGASAIIGISEYRSPRLEENLERGYLTGRYGGLPKLSIANELRAAQRSLDA